jgi:hypothetical protein
MLKKNLEETWAKRKKREKTRQKKQKKARKK